MAGQQEYSQYSDSELIDRLRGGEAAIMDYICNKYKNLVRSKAKSMFLLGADTEDLIQEGMIGLFKAVRDYDPGRDASFYTFAELCISRQLFTAVQAAKREKHQPLNTYVSFDSKSESRDGDERGGICLADSIADKKELNPEEVILDRERKEDLEHAIEAQLSDFEQQVLDLYLCGMHYREIAKILGKDEKATDNALQRLKTKIKKLLNRK